MAKYVDMIVTGAGHAGTTGDPFSWDDLLVDILTGLETSYFIRGSADVTSPPWWPNGAPDYVFNKWGSDPYRIHYTGTNTTYWIGTWNNGTIKCEGNIQLYANSVPANILTVFNSCIVISAGRVICSWSTPHMNGCTVIASGLQVGRFGSGATFDTKDSVFICDSFFQCCKCSC